MISNDSMQNLQHTKMTAGSGGFSNLQCCSCGYMGVSENSGTPKSSILIRFSIINHPFWGSSIFGNTHILEHTVTRVNNE